ncbi:MAG: Na/Pi cotransporter family protein [Oscillospiraceae bacterium]
MTVFSVIQLLGGLALFLYGMSVMSNGLERASGGRLEQMLEKLTSNLFKAILLGCLVTAAIQSSSATTVIVIGLVNARILKLRNAIGVIMGANIGTTITAHIIRLSDIDSGNFFLSLLKPSTLAPLAAIIGILLYYTSKKVSLRDTGLILIGFCVLFTGMFSMEEAVLPLRESEVFIRAFSSLSNPVLGVLAGTAITAIVQSSSASVGILQALTVTGAITASAAFPIILGQNIGTCITSVLASIGTSKNAKRAAFIHVSFNVIGTLVFLIGLYSIQAIWGIPGWNDPIGKGGIADFHTIFNVVSTLLFLPFTKQLEKLANFAVRDNNEGVEIDDALAGLDDRFYTSPSFAISHAREAVVHMAKLSKENFQRSTELVLEFDRKKLELAREVENIIDRLQGRVDSYLLGLSEKELTEADNVALSEVLQVVNEFERIGDHADNLCDIAVSNSETGVRYSQSALREFRIITEAVEEILQMAVDGYTSRDTQLANNIEPLEEIINIMVESLKVHHSKRLQEGDCSIDSAFSFVEILYNMERIADHCSNVGVHIMSYSGVGEIKDRHEFLREIRRTKTPAYKAKFDQYDKKYFGPLGQNLAFSSSSADTAEDSEPEADPVY